MSLRIRLSRGGTKKRPYYRIVVADSRSPRDGRFIERIGSYNPMLPKEHADRLRYDEDRVKHWLGQGAKPSDRLAGFFGAAGLVPELKIHEQTKKSKPKAKALERQAEKEEKAKEAAEAAEAEAAEAAAEPEEAPAEEAPAEEAPVEEAPAEEAAADEAPVEEAAADDEAK